MAKRKKHSNDEGNIRIGEFTSAIMQIAEEKGISKDTVIETIEAAIAAAYKKDYGRRGQHIRAEFNEVTGETKFFLVKEVVDETTREFADDTEPASVPMSIGTAADEAEKIPRYNPERDILFEEAKKINKKAKIGDIIETELETKSDFGRVAAQTAKQVIIQRIREAERDSMYKEYKEKEGEVINGIVQRVEGRNVFVDLGKSIGILFPSEQIESEHYRVGQRIKVYLVKVEADPKGPGIMLSRTHPEIIKKLFELEVPEVFAGTVEIKAITREAGLRTKIAVASKEEGVDPIGSCVGQKGTRVQAVIDELGGEKIDIIEWNDNAEKFISASLSPAKVLAVTLNEETKEAQVLVPENQLSLAIGKRGQNVRLAAKLTGWKINMIGEKAEEESKAEVKEEEKPADVEAIAGKEEKEEKKSQKNISEDKKPEKK